MNDEKSIYGQGRHLNRYPFDSVVSFVFRHRPRNKPPGQTRILELGCGAGNNLWFAAREGFQVFGLDASPSAIAYAKKRFLEEGLTGEFQVGDFTRLPYPDNFFDLVIDRAAIICMGRKIARKTIKEVRRVLATGGKFHFNPYSENHASRASGNAGEDGLTVDISGGTLVGVGQICFYDKAAMLDSFGKGWRVCSLQHIEQVELADSAASIHAEYKLIAEKCP
jgi:SAM-dependent methyltransferase